MNFKKVQDFTSKKGERNNKVKAVTRVVVDILLHVISDSDKKDAIPKPCSDNEVIILDDVHLL